jgi:hypothetical protein
MTPEQQADYLRSKGWKREYDLWRDRKTSYLWELSAAVKQQQFRDNCNFFEGKRKANGKT